nr:PQQ-dependent sugar dehydrogenase [Pseudomonas alcaligenes]
MKLALLVLAVTSLLALIPPAMAERSELGELQLTEVAVGLEHPWALVFLPEGQGYLISERPGRLRLLDAQGRLHPPLGGVPAVFARGQGGLLDIALSPGFATDRLVYLSYAEADDEGQRAGTAVGRGRLKEDLSALEGFRVIFRQLPKLSEGIHFGSRMAFGADGQLYVSLGENNQRATAQQLDKLQGKLVRLQPGGGVPADNPFLGREGVRPEIWSYGHRNPQGLALNPWSGQLWLHEHGPRGGDEINIPKAGRNYGWPKATHGINYSFLPIPEAEGATVAGTEPPHHVWEKSPAISGMAFYSAERFPAWQHSLFIGALAGQALIRLQLQGDQVVHEERLLQDRGWRIRDVRQGPDGFLYLLTDAPDGKLVRLGLATGR